MEKYEVLCDFITLFPFKKGGNTYKEISALQDVIKAALEDGHIKVERINIRIVRKLNGE